MMLMLCTLATTPTTEMQAPSRLRRITHLPIADSPGHQPFAIDSVTTISLPLDTLKSLPASKGSPDAAKKPRDTLMKYAPRAPLTWGTLSRPGRKTDVTELPRIGAVVDAATA